MKSFSLSAWRGRAWTVGHELALDDVMALRFTLLRETNGDVLKAHLFERLGSSRTTRRTRSRISAGGSSRAPGGPRWGCSTKA
jgi:hypothetical protein